VVARGKNDLEVRDPETVAIDAASPAHLVFGDEYPVATLAQRLVNTLCPPAEQSLGLEIVDGRVETVDESASALRRCLEALRTLGFFGGRKLVWLRDAIFLGDAKLRASDLVKPALEDLTEEVAKGLSAGQCLVVSAPSVDGRSSFFKAFKTKGSVYAMALPESTFQLENYARDWARQVFARLQLRLPEAALALFLQKTGPDSRLIAQEAEKLAVYLGDRREARVEDVEAVVSAGRENKVWDLCDAVGKRDLGLALTLLGQLFFQKENPVAIVVQLESRFRELLFFRLAQEQRWMRVSSSGRQTEVSWNESEKLEAIIAGLGRDPRRTHPFRLKLLAEQSANFSARELAEAQLQIVAAHERLVTTSLDPELVLEVLLSKLLGGAGAEAAVSERKRT